MGFQTRRRVEFRDTDAAGIVHFSAFFPWMESAEHEMLRSAGIQVLPSPEEHDQAVTWPRVSVSCDYHSAIRFEDWIDIEVAVSKIGRSSVHYLIRFSRSDDGDSGRKPVATGKVVTVCCRLSAAGLEKTEIPAGIREKLESLQST